MEPSFTEHVALGRGRTVHSATLIQRHESSPAELGEHADDTSAVAGMLEEISTPDSAMGTRTMLHRSVRKKLTNFETLPSVPEAKSELSSPVTKSGAHAKHHHASPQGLHMDVGGDRASWGGSMASRERRGAEHRGTTFKSRTQRMRSQASSSPHASGIAKRQNGRPFKDFLRHRVLEVFEECVQVAKFRLHAAEAINRQQPSSKSILERAPQHSWVSSQIAPLMWVRFCSPLHGLGVQYVRPEHNKTKKTKTKMDFLQVVREAMNSKSNKSLSGASSAEPSDTEKAAIDQGAKRLPVDPRCDRLREDFHMAMAEAKLAQAQAVAAQKDVHSLRMAVRRLRAANDGTKATIQPPPGTAATSSSIPNSSPREGGNARTHAGHSSIDAARGAYCKMLQARREQLRREELELSSGLHELQRQNQRLMLEIERRQLRIGNVSSGASQFIHSSSSRAATAPAALGHSFRPKVLPEIGDHAVSNPMTFAIDVLGAPHSARPRLGTADGHGTAGRGAALPAIDCGNLSAR